MSSPRAETRAISAKILAQLAQTQGAARQVAEQMIVFASRQARFCIEDRSVNLADDILRVNDGDGITADDERCGALCEYMPQQQLRQQIQLARRRRSILKRDQHIVVARDIVQHVEEGGGTVAIFGEFGGRQFALGEVRRDEGQ